MGTIRACKYKIVWRHRDQRRLARDTRGTGDQWRYVQIQCVWRDWRDVETIKINSVIN